MRDILGPDLFKIYHIDDGELLLTYKGPVDKYIVHSFGQYINDYMEKCNNSNTFFYKIFMELAQNTALHSLEVKEFSDGNKIGIGSMALYKKDGFLNFQIGNHVNINEIDPIIDKCEKINSMDRNELREFKRQERAKPFREHGGGNIGLIQVALDSNNPLDFKVTKINSELAFFAVCVKIKC